LAPASLLVSRTLPPARRFGHHCSKGWEHTRSSLIIQYNRRCHCRYNPGNLQYLIRWLFFSIFSFWLQTGSFCNVWNFTSAMKCWISRRQLSLQGLGKYTRSPDANCIHRIRSGKFQIQFYPCPPEEDAVSCHVKLTNLKLSHKSRRPGCSTCHWWSFPGAGWTLVHLPALEHLPLLWTKSRQTMLTPVPRGGGLGDICWRLLPPLCCSAACCLVLTGDPRDDCCLLSGETLRAATCDSCIRR
jgi:hypothetical protein